MTHPAANPVTSAVTAAPENGEFDRTTAKWGRYTLLAGLVASLAGPAYLLFVAGFWPGVGPILTALAAVTAIFAVYWVLEPVTYFPMLGSAGLYQAFLIGNISNKLLPAAVSAQAAIGAKPGTRRAEIAASAAICGAALVHVISLVLLVGIGGTWLLSALPESFISTFDYILPAVLGPVVVQLFYGVEDKRSALTALAVAVVMALVVVAQVPALAPFGLMLTVLLGVVLAVVTRSRRSEPVESM
jgi:hypothetical protein